MDEYNLREVEFFGKITAGITHELKNVLAVIKETSGLMGDILDMKGAQEFQGKERFIKAISTIQRQVENGDTLLTRLNKFAHSPDKENAESDLHNVIQELFALCDRYIRQKNITVNVQHPENVVKFTANPVSLQLVLFSCLNYCILSLPQQAQIDVTVQQDTGSEYVIRFNCSEKLSGTEAISTGDEVENRLRKLHNTTDIINGKIEISLSTLLLKLHPQS